METLSMSNVSVETQVAHVAAAVAAVAQMQQEHLEQLSPNNNNSHSAVAMEQEDMQDNLVNLSDMQEIEEIQEDIVSIPKEVILISLVSQEQALYNPKHEHYRNTQRKDTKWLDIAESVGWSETQCKAKWKAMRDQYCRELKRSKFNAKANVKWKYFKELDFLRPYALSRNYRPRNSLNICNNNNNITILQNTSTTIASVVSNINNNNHHQQQQQQHQQENNKFPNIKIEAGQFDTTDFVTATQIKSNDRLIATLTDEQLNVMQEQQQQDGNWNYITTTTAAALARNNNELHINNSSGSNNSNNMHITTTTTTTADDTLYNSFVAQITQQNNILVTAAGQIHQQHQQQQQHHQQLQQAQLQHAVNPEEEDDDPIHTFLNYESYFEKELITMIQQEDILYNSFHPNYRNVKMKLEVWDEIARKLKKTIKQCRLKWKALRDQYIREHKRLKNRENPESLPRWKHYDALSFLQKFIKHKSGELEKNIIEIPKTEIDIDMDEPCLQSPTVSPLHVANDLQQQQLQQQLQQALPSLSGPHTVVNSSSQQVQNTLQQQLQQSLQQQTQLLQQAQQQHQQHQQQQQQHQVHDVNDDHDESLCGVASGDVSGYDDMDINDYIIGDADDGAGGPDDEDIDDDDDEDIDRKSQQFPIYSPHIDTAANSNDEHEANDDLDHQQVEFKVSHDSSLTQAQTPNSHSMSQQSVAMQQHLQQHQQHIIKIDNDGNTQQQQQQNEQNFADSLQASLLNGTVTTATPTATTAAKTNEVLHAAVAGVGITVGSTHNDAVATSTNANNSATSTDDDEVGAFFKAVAMKIRNAKMSPVAFTDLQIDILRVINGTLRNH